MEARVLIVEDEALIALHLEQLVTDAGHRVVGIALDPTEARELTRRYSPHFAFVDVRLRNGTSGLEVARYLREEHDVPAIIVSGNLDRELKDAAEAYRPIGFVGKPFFPSEITVAIGAAAADMPKERYEACDERSNRACRPGLTRRGANESRAQSRRV